MRLSIAAHDRLPPSDTITLPVMNSGDRFHPKFEGDHHRDGQGPPSPPTHLTRELAARRLFSVPPCRKGTTHLQTSIPSPESEPRPYSTAVSVDNHYTGWVTDSESNFIKYNCEYLIQKKKEFLQSRVKCVQSKQKKIRKKKGSVPGTQIVCSTSAPTRDPDTQITTESWLEEPTPLVHDPTSQAKFCRPYTKSSMNRFSLSADLNLLSRGRRQYSLIQQRRCSIWAVNRIFARQFGDEQEQAVIDYKKSITKTIVNGPRNFEPWLRNKNDS
ncbi:hypothetical protein TNCV_1391011 [Trichonephila clavipes]|nr:hypothetical protein TNCV_1391011 [Trichonephila clavipes]